MTQTYALTEHVDTTAAPTLANDLGGLRGRDICIDASSATFIGALGMQVLLSARRQWMADGLTLSIAPTSEAFCAAAKSLGVDLADIGAGSSTQEAN